MDPHTGRGPRRERGRDLNEKSYAEFSHSLISKRSREKKDIANRSVRD